MEKDNNIDTEQIINTPNGNYLINKLAITNNYELLKKEYEISSKKLYTLLLDPLKTLIPLKNKYKITKDNESLIFDENLFLAIHYYLFSDIYYFAGEYKHQLTYAKGRGNANSNYFAMFNQLDAVPENLHYALKGMNNEIANISIPNKEYLASKLADYFLTIVNIHPFREGNGRTLSAYFSIFMDLNMNNSYKNLDCTYLLDWSKTNKDIFQNVMYEEEKDPTIIKNEFLKALIEIPKTNKLKL